MRSSAAARFEPRSERCGMHLYVPEQRSLQVSFYLRDEPNDDKSKPRTARKTYLEFALEKPRAQ